MHWHLTKRLDQEIVYEEKLLIALYQMLFSSPETEKRVNALDKRMLPEKMLSSTTQANATLVDINKAETDVGKYLLVLFLLTWMFERILAFKKINEGIFFYIETAKALPALPSNGDVIVFNWVSSCHSWYNFFFH